MRDDLACLILHWLVLATDQQDQNQNCLSSGMDYTGGHGSILYTFLKRRSLCVQNNSEISYRTYNLTKTNSQYRDYGDMKGCLNILCL